MAISAPAAGSSAVGPSAAAASAAALSSLSRTRLSTSLEPLGMAGTSWNSIRWARPSAGAGYRTSRLASAFETSGGGGGANATASSACSSSSAASTACSAAAAAARAQSPPSFGSYAKLRSSDRAASTSRPHNDGAVIRANSRYGASLLSSSNSQCSPISARTVSQHCAVAGSSSLKSPRQAATTTIVAYRPISGSAGISQSRAALIDMRQNLRPVNKRHSVTDHHLHHNLHTHSAAPMRTSSASTLLSNSVRSAFVASSSAMASARYANVSPTSSSTNKCVTSPSMSRSSSTVTSPVTTVAPRPIPKSERPWRQKLADAQRLRDAQEERERHQRLPSSSEPSASSASSYDATTMRLISATKSVRRANIEQQQQEAEQKLEKQIAALKCYVSEPGALDSNATVAKFRQRMAEGPAPASLTSLSSASASANGAAVVDAASPPQPSVSASASSSLLLARMPSLNRRATTAVMQQDVQQQQQQQQQQTNVDGTISRKKKDRPISLVETALAGTGSRRLSVVKEGSVSGDTPRPGSTDEQMSSPTPTAPEAASKPLLPAATNVFATSNGNSGKAAATTAQQSSEQLKSGATKESPKLGKKRRGTTATTLTATTTAQTKNVTQISPSSTGSSTTATATAAAQQNSNNKKDSAVVAVVAKRKALPKMTPATTTAQPPATTTTTTAQQQQRQVPLVKRLFGNNNNKSASDNSGANCNKTAATPSATKTTAQPKKNGTTSNSYSNREEEEDKYNAVVQFRPQSLLQRKLSSNSAGGAVPRKSSSASLSQLGPDSLDELRPVPGTWLRSTKERCISHNKHLIRRAASESKLHIHRAVPVLRVTSTRLLSPGWVAKKCESAFVNRLYQAHNAAISVRTKGHSPTATVLKMIKSIARPKQRICAVAVLDKALSNKRRLRLGIQKTLLQKSAPKKLCAHLRCKSAKSVTTAARLHIVWKEQKKQVAVTILLAEDVPELNWCRVTSELIREQQQQQQLLKPISTSSSPLKRLQLLAMAQDSSNGTGTTKTGTAQKQQANSVNSSANFPAQNLPGHQRVATVPTAAFGATTQRQQRDKQQHNHHQQQHQAVQPAAAAQFAAGGTGGGCGVPPQLILPDQSLLERCVQRKRDALAQLHRDANANDDDAAGAVEEALHGTAATPSAPALFAPRAAAVAVSASLPGSKRNSQMLAAVTAPSGAELPQSLTGSFHSAIEATAADLRAAAAAAQPRLRRAQQQQQLKQKQIPVLSTQAFEKPKSLFEEQMQRQAIQLRQRGAVVRQSMHDDDDADHNGDRDSVASKQQAQAVPATQQLQQQRRRSGVAVEEQRSSAADAVAPAVVGTQQVTALKPLQHEQQRYAAHIPVSSGRQSTTNCESANNSSGAQLDSATRRLDQMIDQARYRHSQHRNKFKEAIDYLDHIFEDFQREAADAAARPNGKKDKAAAQPKQQHQHVQAVQQQHPKQPQVQAVQQQQQRQDESSAGAIEPVQATFRQGSVKSAKEAFEKVAAAIASEKQNSKLRKQPSAPSSSAQQQQKPAKVPLRSVPSFPTTTATTNATATVGAGGEGGAGTELADVEVAETIVLPSKNSAERLEFTKHWVSSGAEGGAVGVWAQGAPHRRDDPLLGIHSTEASTGGYESDEHSLGSCSVEVAAINAADQQRRRRHNQQQAAAPQAKKKTAAPAAPSSTHHQQQQKAVATVAAGAAAGAAVPTKTVAQQQQQQRHAKQQHANGTTATDWPLPQIIAAPSCATSRPQPFRPQPQLGVLPLALVAAASTSGEQQHQSLHKVPSIEQLRLMRSSQERAGSQDYHSMASSVHSQDGFRPAASCLSTLSLQRIGLGSSGGGAFHSYTPTTPQQKQSSVPTFQYQPNQHQQHPQQQQQLPQQQQLKGSIQSLPDSALSAGGGIGGTKGCATYSSCQPSSFGGSTTQCNNQRQFATLARMDSNQQQHQRHGGVGGSSTATSCRPQQQQQQHHRVQPVTATTGGGGGAAAAAALAADHALAIDALVAELELNTTDTAIAAAEKRRSFPTMQTEVARTKAKMAGGTTVTQQRQHVQSSQNLTNRPIANHHYQQNNHNSINSISTKPLEKLNELMSMDDESSRRTRRTTTTTTTAQQQQQTQQVPLSAGGNRAFETINQEKLNPSKVDAMARMFNGKQTTTTTSGGGVAPAALPKTFTSGGDQPQQQQSWATRRAATIGGGRTATGAVPSSSSTSAAARHHHNGVVGDVPSLLTPNGHHAVAARHSTHQPQHPTLKKQYTLPAMVSAAAASVAPLSSRIYRSANGAAAAAGLLELGAIGSRCRTGNGATAATTAKRDGTPTVAAEDGAATGGGTGAGTNCRRLETNGIGTATGANNSRNNFYDNVQNAVRNGRGGGRTSPAGYGFSGNNHNNSSSNNDAISLCSQQEAALPPATSSASSKSANGTGGGGGAGGRIGQLIRKLGNSVGGGNGGGAKVPSSATSTLSLNRVLSNDHSLSGVGTADDDDDDHPKSMMMASAVVTASSCAAASAAGNGNGTLTKSTSLSGEPWRYQVLMAHQQQQQQNGGGRRNDGQSKQQSHHQQQQQNGGIGNRLKQTIFGSAIRRRVPT